MRRRLLAAAALAGFVAALWCLAHGRTSRAAFDVPVDYSGDSLGHTLAYLKAAADGHVRPLGTLEVAELNAPFAASWNDFPRQHKLQFWLAGFAARSLGLFPAANLLLLLAHVLAGLSFFVVAGYFRVRLEWTLAGSLAFALSPYLSYRSLAHLNLSFDWPLPLGVLVATWCFARGGIALGSRRFWVAAAIAAATGLHHAYYSAFLGQFLLLAAAAQLLRGHGLRRALPPVLLAAVLVLVAAVDNLGSIAYARREGPNPASVWRPYGNLERFALKPVELLLPPEGFGPPPLRAAAATYYEGAIYRGEMGSAYLGLLGIAALAWLVATALRAARGAPPRRVPSAFLAVSWALAYSVVGGLNAIVGALGFVWLRATNRFSIWILAVVLLWAGVQLSRVLGDRPRSASVLAAALAAALALADQLPILWKAGTLPALQRVVASDRALTRSIEAALPRAAMIFELPVMDGPEGQPVGKATPHEHLRPYLYSKELRFSYGSDKGRPREAWQRRAEALEPAELARALERIGFAGLLVNRKGYEDGAADLRQQLAASGREEAWESSDGDFLFVRLRPEPQPSAPDTVLPPPDDAKGPAS